MSKYLVTSGCSFTAHSVEPTIAWPYHMPNWQVVNCAEMASGNSLISRNLIATIPHYIDKKPTVAVMWSNPNRFELFYNTESNNYDKIYNTMKDAGGFLNQPYTGKWKAHKTSNWAKSGGGFGLWDFDSKDWVLAKDFPVGTVFAAIPLSPELMEKCGIDKSQSYLDRSRNDRFRSIARANYRNSYCGDRL